MGPSKRFLQFSFPSLLLMALGCGSGIAPTSTGVVPTIPVVHTATVYVLQYDAATKLSSVLQFPADSQGSVAPSNAITAPAGLFLNGLGVDGTGNVYVLATSTTSPGNEILVFAPGASGNATPIRTITGLSPTIIDGMTVDDAGQVYLFDGGQISIFATGASGNATPIRQITTTSSLGPIAVDSAQNIYIGPWNLTTTAGSIVVFGPTATGNAPPIRVLSGFVDLSMGLAVDPSGNLFASEYFTGGNASSEILEFAPSANANAAPVRVLTSFDIGHYVGGGIALDSANNIYTVNDYNLQPSVYVYSVSDFSKGSPPTRVFSSSSWTVPDLGQIVVR